MYQLDYNVFISKSTFKRYLREEKIEVQLWCGSGGGLGHHFHRQSDRSRDKLIGSAWIPLGGLCQGQRKKSSQNQVYKVSFIF